MLQRLIGLCCACFLMSISAFAGDDVPPWLKQAASTNAPPYNNQVPAAVLFDEQRVAVAEDGRITTTSMRAVRVLNREGREFVHAFKTYQTDTEKVREMRAWLIRPSGEVKKYGKDQTLELALDNDVYNEYRTRIINAEKDAEVGAVFGYETVSEDRSVFTQFEWQFQNRLPALVSRFILTVPPGWRADGTAIGLGGGLARAGVRFSLG